MKVFLPSHTCTCQDTFACWRVTDIFETDVFFGDLRKKKEGEKKISFGVGTGRVWTHKRYL
jgi:hypothetical protein